MLSNPTAPKTTPPQTTTTTITTLTNTARLRLVQVIAVVHSSGILGGGEASAVAGLLKHHGPTLQNKFVEAIVVRLEGGK